MVNRFLCSENFDEQLIKLKKVPILHPTLSLDSKLLQVNDVIVEVDGVPLGGKKLQNVLRSAR